MFVKLTRYASRDEWRTPVYVNAELIHEIDPCHQRADGVCTRVHFGPDDYSDVSELAEEIVKQIRAITIDVGFVVGSLDRLVEVADAFDRQRRGM